MLGLVRRQARLIVATMFGVCTLAALVLYQLTPVFTASTLIIVDPRQESILDPNRQNAVVPSDQGLVDSEVEILRSPPLFLSVVRDLKLFRDPEFAPGPGWSRQIKAIFGLESPVPTADDILKSTIVSLQSATTVARIGITYLIQVSVRSKDPQKAATIANALARAYIDNQVNAKVVMLAGVEQALAGRLGEASARLRGAEASLDDFIAKNIDSVADDASRRDLAGLRDRITSRSAETERLVSLVDLSGKDLAGKDWQRLVGEIDSDSLRTLYNQREAISKQLSQAATNEQQAFDLRASLAKLDAEMESQASAAIDHVRGQLDASRTAEQDLRQEMRDRIVHSDLPKDALVKLYEIQQEANATRTVYQDLLTRSKNIESQRNIQVADSRIVSEALPPLSPSFPKKGLSLILAGAVSLMLGFGLAILRENYVGGFLSEAQAEHILRLSVISSLPRLPGQDGQGKANPAEIVEHPLSTYSEAVRRARLALEMESRGDGGNGHLQVIMVTSALPDEGKTQTAISLARSFAVAGKKTLLIDCDCRRPSVHKVLGLKPGKGLLELLAEGDQPVGLDAVAVPDPLTRLSLVLGARGARTATDTIFEGAGFEAMIAGARDKYDVVILDSSPVAPVVDPRLLLRHADAVVMVVKWASTSQPEVSAAINELERVNRNGIPIAVILNSSSVGAAGYRAAEYYAGYYETEA